jgi:hypothetical protein
MPWSEEVILKEGETRALKPTLQFKEYPSTITLSTQP